MSDLLEKVIRQLKNEEYDEDCPHAYLMGALDRLYHNEKRLTRKEFEEGKKLIAIIPPTKWENEHPKGMDYA